MIDLNENYFITGSKTESGKNRLIPIHRDVKKYFIYFYEKANNYLFVSSINQDKKLSYETFKLRFKKTQEKIGITEHKIHDTRHTFASLMSNVSADDVSIAKILGHKDFKTTSSIYIHKKLEILEKEISKIKIK